LKKKIDGCLYFFEFLCDYYINRLELEKKFVVFPFKTMWNYFEIEKIICFPLIKSFIMKKNNTKLTLIFYA